MTTSTTVTSADLTTIVVNWNTAHLLDDCLRSVLAATPAGVQHEVVVVDNASTDGSVAHLREHWPRVRVLVNDRNEGFCRANNRALRETTAPVVLLVNTDARLAPDTVEVLLRRLEQDPLAGVVAPRLTYGDGSFQRWTAGRDVDLRSAAAYLLMVDRVAPRRSGGMYLGTDTAVAFRPDWVSSAVMAVRRRALDEVGLLDEDIFVYMDDVDLCRRVRARGWHVWYEPGTTAVHFMGGSSERDPGAASRAALRGLNHWFAGVHGRPAAHALRGLEVVGFGARAALYGTAAAARPSSTARAHARAHVTHLRQALEPLDD